MNLKSFIVGALTFLFIISCRAKPINKYAGSCEMGITPGDEGCIVFHISEDGKTDRVIKNVNNKLTLLSTT